MKSGASGSQSQRILGTTESQSRAVLPGAAAGAATGPAWPAGHPAQAQGSAGKGLLPGAATAHASSRKTGLPAAVSAHRGAGGQDMEDVRSTWCMPAPPPHLRRPSLLPRPRPSPLLLPAGLQELPHSWPRWGGSPSCGLRRLGICLSGEKKL